MLLFCEVCEPLQLWENNWTLLSNDVLYIQRKQLGYSELQLSENQLKNYALLEIEKILLTYGKTLRDYPPLPSPHENLVETSNNSLIAEQLYLDREELATEHGLLSKGLNEEQKLIYNDVVEAIKKQKGGFYFVYGHGGTGKTYLYQAIISRLRYEGEIVLAVASSGIASLLLPLGRTAHSRFEIPIDLTNSSTCNIRQGTQLTDLLRTTKLIIWDKAPMAHRHCFEALDRSLRDILRITDENAKNTIFGGKTVLLGGDFRQILPVVPKSRREDIVGATISRSKLWEECKVYTLHRNMRLQQTSNEEDSKKIEEFSNWILSIGEGTIPLMRMEGEDEDT